MPGPREWRSRSGAESRCCGEAERLHLDVEYFSSLFDLYSQEKRPPEWWPEQATDRIVAWAENLSFFTLLEYVGRLTILLAIRGDGGPADPERATVLPLGAG